MSKNFDLMNRGARDSVGSQLGRPAPRSAANSPAAPPTQMLGGADETLGAVLWRVIRNRRWTIGAFALTVVAFVASASLLMKPKYEAVATVPVKVTFVKTRVSNEQVAGLQAKGAIKDVSGNVIGELLSVQATATREELLTTDGQNKAFPSTLRSDVTFVVSGQGTVSDSTVHIGKLVARVGADVRIVGPGYEAQTTIANVVWGPEALK